MDPSATKVLATKDQTVDNITQNVITINSQGPNSRLTFVMERLVTHLHDFARETRLSTEEWMAGLLFLTAVGQKCTPGRQVCLHPFRVACVLNSLRCPGIYLTL